MTWFAGFSSDNSGFVEQYAMKKLSYRYLVKFRKIIFSEFPDNLFVQSTIELTITLQKNP